MAKIRRVPESEWKWFGRPAHFICAEWCRFHMATQIGDYLVSTVGLYIPPYKTGGSECGEEAYRASHPNGKEIGPGRFYETMVFRAGEPCKSKGCRCGMPTINGSELLFAPYQTVGEATEGHADMCARVARGEAQKAELTHE